MANAGKFAIEVSPPHPCWCRLTYGDKILLTFRHDEIRDLEFVVDRAKADAERQLHTNHKDEIR